MKTTNDIKDIVTAWQYGRMGDDDAMYMIEEILRRDGIIEDHPEGKDSIQGIRMVRAGKMCRTDMRENDKGEAQAGKTSNGGLFERRLA